MSLWLLGLSHLSLLAYSKSSLYLYVTTICSLLRLRLSKDASIKVGLLEAGQYIPDDPLIDTPGRYPLATNNNKWLTLTRLDTGMFGRTLGNPQYDWAFFTEPQSHLNGRPIFQPRGKVLGGSSAVCSCRSKAKVTSSSIGNSGCIVELHDPGQVRNFHVFYSCLSVGIELTWSLDRVEHLKRNTMVRDPSAYPLLVSLFLT